MGILVGGGSSVSNYLQGVMGPRRNGYFILAGEISRFRDVKHKLREMEAAKRKNREERTQKEKDG